jgi:hypothetical protein
MATDHPTARRGTVRLCLLLVRSIDGYIWTAGSMGPIVGRANAHVIAIDNGIVMALGHLMRAACRGGQERGTALHRSGQPSRSLRLGRVAGREALTARPSVAPASI